MLPSLLTTLLLLHSSLAWQCMHYRARMPFDDTLPFEASITEHNSPGTPLCWVKTTYQEHNLMQTLANQFPSPEDKRKDEAGKGDYATWGFKRWDMICLPGYQAWVNVGLRTIQIIDSREVGNGKGGKRKITGWVAGVSEDFYASAWTFSKDHGCEPPKPAALSPAAAAAAEQKKIMEGVQKVLTEAMKKIDAQQQSKNGNNKVVSEEDKKIREGAKEIIRVALKEVAPKAAVAPSSGGRQQIKIT